MSAEPPVHLLIAALAGSEPEAAAKVFDRVSAALGADGLAVLLSRAVALPDGFVRVVAERGSPRERTALATNPCLTPDQLIALIEVGGQDAVRAVFLPVDTGRGTNFAPAPQTDPQAAEKRTAEAIRAAETAPETLDAETAIAVLQEADCPVRRAVGLLRAQPLLAHAARVPPVDPAFLWSRYRPRRLSTLLQRLDRPWESVTELADDASVALARGALTAEDLCTRVAPALIGVQAMGKLLRSHEPCFADKAAADAHVLPLLARTVGTDPHAWARLASRLGTAATPLARLLADVASIADAAGNVLTPGAADGSALTDGSASADGPAPPDGFAPADGPAPAGAPIITPPAKARSALLFLIRRLPADDIGALLPYFDEQVTADLIQGDTPVPPELLELAHRTGNRTLLRKVAAHQHLRDEQARRVRDYDDVEFDRHLVWNRAGVGAALRREILAGFVPGGRPRRPMDAVLRQWVVETPAHLEPKTVVFCGDPVLVCLALPKSNRLRRIDLVDIALSVWERTGPQAVAEVLASVPEAFPPAVRKIVDAALAAGSPDGLVAARARLDRSKKAGPKTPEEPLAHDLPPGERLVGFALSMGAETWARTLPAADLVRWGRGAHAVLALLPVLSGDGRGDEVRAALLDAVVGPLGSAPEAWAVLVQLLPDFEGTLPELAELSAAAAHQPAGAA